MPFALNLYDLIPGKEDTYREYIAAATVHLGAVGASLVAAAETPLKQLAGDNRRDHMVVVHFPDAAAFERFHALAEADGLHALRESATTNYVWTLYDDWDLETWMGK